MIFENETEKRERVRVVGFLGKERGREEKVRERERDKGRKRKKKKDKNNRIWFKSFLPQEITVIYTFF